MNGPPLTDSEKAARQKARRTLTYLLLFSIVMFFAGLLSAYIVSMSAGFWTRITMPEAFVTSTVVILGGSASIHMALFAARQGKNLAVTLWIAVTLLLGVSFTFSQFSGWNTLVSRGITFNPNHMMGFTGEYGKDYSYMKDGKELVPMNGHFYLPDDLGHARPLDAELDEQRDRTGPYLYALTILHVVHLAFGLLSLAIMLAMALRARYTPEDHVGLWAGALYWHFLGGLWVVLFLFLSLVH